MIDHFNLPVSNIEKSLPFYTQILEVLGYSLLFEDQDAFGFGNDNWQFGLYQSSDPINPLHAAFVAPDHSSVDRFHDLAISLGAQSNGVAGLRPQYGETYYASYLIDFDNHNIEAVCR